MSYISKKGCLPAMLAEGLTPMKWLSPAGLIAKAGERVSFNLWIDPGIQRTGTLGP